MTLSTAGTKRSFDTSSEYAPNPKRTKKETSGYKSDSLEQVVHSALNSLATMIAFSMADDAKNLHRAEITLHAFPTYPPPSPYVQIPHQQQAALQTCMLAKGIIDRKNQVIGTIAHLLNFLSSSHTPSLKDLDEKIEPHLRVLFLYDPAFKIDPAALPLLALIKKRSPSISYVQVLEMDVQLAQLQGLSEACVESENLVKSSLKSIELFLEGRQINKLTPYESDVVMRLMDELIKHYPAVATQIENLIQKLVSELDLWLAVLQQETERLVPEEGSQESALPKEDQATSETLITIEMESMRLTKRELLRILGNLPFSATEPDATYNPMQQAALLDRVEDL